MYVHLHVHTYIQANHIKGKRMVSKSTQTLRGVLYQSVVNTKFNFFFLIPMIPYCRHTSPQVHAPAWSSRGFYTRLHTQPFLEFLLSHGILSTWGQAM